MSDSCKPTFYFRDALQELRPEKEDHEEDFDHGLEDLGIYESVFASSERAEDACDPMQASYEVEKHKSGWTASHGSEVKANRVKSMTTGSSVKSIDSGKEHGPTIEANPQRRFDTSPPLDRDHLGTYGPMRKEKEWNRTLACKLFEERRNADGDEGMDSLWETYENDLTKSKMENGQTKKDKKMKEEDEEGDELDVQLCCLQALRFSSRKMNLGIGRPSLVRMSKAVKGIGWLHHDDAKRHSKKVHNNGD